MWPCVRVGATRRSHGQQPDSASAHNGVARPEFFDGHFRYFRRRAPTAAVAPEQRQSDQPACFCTVRKMESERDSSARKWTLLAVCLTTFMPVPFALLLMFTAAALGSGVLSVTIERVAFKPLRDSSRIAPLITALGVSVFLQNAVLLLLGPDIRNYDASSFIPFTSGIHAGPLNVSLIRIIVIVTTVAVMIALTLWVGRSKLGRSMRAVSYDREAAQMIGVDVDRTIMQRRATARSAGVRSRPGWR